MTDKTKQTGKPETLDEGALDAAAGGWELRNVYPTKIKNDPEVTRLGGNEQFPKLGGQEQLPN